MKNYWMIECKIRDYHTNCFDTKKEAIYRLNEMSNESFYTCNLPIVKRAIDFFELSDNAKFQVVKL